MNRFIKRIIYNIRGIKYNIGFIEGLTPEKLLEERPGKFSDVEWMRHDYKDRWFADPFILDVNPKVITLLAEEQDYNSPGRIVELRVNRSTKTLTDRRVLLELDTHLSYPAILRYNDAVYIYPENGASATLNIYRYDPENGLVKPVKLLDETVYDATITYSDDTRLWYMFATDIKHEGVLYSTQNPLRNWKVASCNTVVKGRQASRMGGGIFLSDNKLYRVAQDCEKRYGYALRIFRINSFEPWSETELFIIKPASWKYHLGIHTLNFGSGDLAVIDGYEYRHPVLGRILAPAVNKFIAVLYNCLKQMRI